jgi:hypothetical protein
MGPMRLLDRFLRPQSWESGFEGFLPFACGITARKKGVPNPQRVPSAGWSR